GPEGNLLDPTPESCRQITLPYPVIDNDEWETLLGAGETLGFPVARVAGLYPLRAGGAGIEARLAEICQQVSAEVGKGARLVVLSDRGSTAELAPIPSLLLGCAAAGVAPDRAIEWEAEWAATGVWGALAPATAIRHYVHALNKGVLKIMSKTGISTVASYRGAQIFEAVGLDVALL